jgi:uncharacterized protein YlxW (UPF0749 family)
VTAVAFVLGLLVVAQLRLQQTTPALAGVSSQDLTVLVANLNTGNDQLRGEIVSLERELGQLRGDQLRGETSLDQLHGDLDEVRAFAGLAPVVGRGVRVTVAGPIAGPSVEELVNELRNAGAEAIAVDDVRMVPGVVVAGPPAALAVEGVRLGDPFEVRAVGSPDTLVGSLTRTGGLIAQLAATEPLASLTVTPTDRIVLPATARSLIPANGRPRL